MANTLAKVGGAFSLLAILLAVVMKRQSNYKDLNAEMPNILNSLRKAERKVEVDASVKIAIGFGGCMDVFVDAVALLQAMSVKQPDKPLHHGSIGNEQQLAEGFVYFFEYGAAAERYMNNATLFDKMVKTARTLNGTRSALGGNAPVMANRFAVEGAEVLLAAQASSDFKKLLRPGIKLTGSQVDHSDIHLIMEYKTGEKWTKYKSARANRYIVHSDKFNPTIESLEPLMKTYKEFKPSLLVVGGLQMLDNFPFRQGERTARLKVLQNLLVDATSRKTLTHFELASFVDESLVSELMERVLPYSDSIGMNEQELPNLLSFLKFGNITMISETYPRVATVLDQMRQVYQLLRKSHKRVSRLHVHTLAFQAIMTKRTSRWKHTMSAAAHASLTANRHICGTKYVDIERSKLLLDESFSTTVDEKIASRVPFEPDRPVSCWEEDYGDGEKVLVCIAPNLVCTKVYQTAGGGDNISSAGLIFQI